MNGFLIWKEEQNTVGHHRGLDVSNFQKNHIGLIMTG
jgi:hypothetical protein